jgi:hypothetical protein
MVPMHENHNDYTWSDANNTSNSQSQKSLPRYLSKQRYHMGFLWTIKKKTLEFMHDMTT